MTTSDPLVWIDCEMTGLDLGADALIEVAVVVTDYELKPLGEGIDVLIKWILTENSAKRNWRSWSRG